MIYTDTFAEIIEKLIILHIRTWMLEDRCSNARSLKVKGMIKKKLDILFKEKRPALIKALDNIIMDIAKGKLKYNVENLKQYGK